MNDQEKAFERVLSLVEDAGCQAHVILIGSWAEYVYRESGLLRGFSPNIHTLDVDFLVKNLRRPRPPASLAVRARQEGFLVESDRLLGTTKLFDPSGLEVEFLINQLGSGVEPVFKTNLGVTAQALRHMGILLTHITECFCFGHQVTVPTPEAYVVHKMVINGQRGRKAEKDAQAVLLLWPHLGKDALGELNTTLTKKERRNVQEFMRAYDLAFP